MDFEDIWAGPARKGRISAYKDGRGGSRQSKCIEEVGQWDDSFQAETEKRLPIPGLHPLTLNFVSFGFDLPAIMDLPFFPEELPTRPALPNCGCIPGILKSCPYSHLPPKSHPRKLKTHIRRKVISQLHMFLE